MAWGDGGLGVPVFFCSGSAYAVDMLERIYFLSFFFSSHLAFPVIDFVNTGSRRAILLICLLQSFSHAKPISLESRIYAERETHQVIQSLLLVL